MAQYIVIATDVDFENQTVNGPHLESNNITLDEFLEFVEIKRKQTILELEERIAEDDENEGEPYTINDLFEFNEQEMELKLYYTHDVNCGYESFKLFQI